MNRVFASLLIIGRLGLFLNTIQGSNGFAQSTSRNFYDASYLYLNRHPDNGTPNWGDNNTATQGIAHDNNNWYISATGTTGIGLENDDWIIWRIPVSEDINQDFSNSLNPEVRHVRRADVPVLDNAGFHHPGDLDHFRYGGTDYLIVPMSNGIGRAIVVFDAADLSFISFAYLSGQDDIGWCAVGPDSILVSSNDNASELRRYIIDWPRLASESVLSISSPLAPQELFDSTGGAISLSNMQGGEFSPSGDLFFASCGLVGSAASTDGIHVFSTSTWWEVKRSSNQERGELGYFDYSFNDVPLAGDEPEGLTLWDLDDGRAPNVRGQLHAVVYSHNLLTTNEVTLMHYQNKLYVDGVNGSPPTWSYPLPGTPLGPPINGRPFNSVNSAYKTYPVWDGAQLVIQAGSYPETGKFSARVRFVSQGGVATLGR